MKYQIFDSKKKKICLSKNYNFIFDKETGFFARWGKDQNDDPTFSPIGPEIADIEVTTICKGVGGKLCKACYKSNTPNGINMSFDTFRHIFDLLNQKKALCQIAFGADSRCESNPDIWKMFEYCRQNGVIPNITVADITDETAKKLASVCGAVAVSRYENKDICYDSIARLAAHGMKQINIHICIEDGTYAAAMETMQDKLVDPRLASLKAIVMLSLKRKGRGVNMTPLDSTRFKSLVDFGIANNIGIGFDSCSCYKFLNSVRNSDRFVEFATMSEPCESMLTSFYASVEGICYPCSFCEDMAQSEVLGQSEEFDWRVGIDLANVKDFLDEVWYNPKIVKWRNCLIANKDNDLDCRQCPMYVI